MRCYHYVLVKCNNRKHNSAINYHITHTDSLYLIQLEQAALPRSSVIGPSYINIRSENFTDVLLTDSQAMCDFISLLHFFKMSLFKHGNKSVINDPLLQRVENEQD